MNNGKTPVKNSFVVFSAIFFLFILVAGGIAFAFSMRQIVRENKGLEMSQILETAQIWLESTVNAEISMVLKMAESPAIKLYFENPDEADIQAYALREMYSFRRFFSDGEIFYINDIDRIFYMDNREPYWLDAEDPVNDWYYKTILQTEDYNFNINYNPDIEALDLWINAPVFNSSRKPIGMLGIGIELSSFIDRVFKWISDRGEFYFFDGNGEITGAANVGFVGNKTSIADVFSHIDIDIIAEAKSLAPGEMGAFSVNGGEIAVGTVPLLEWYSVVFIANSIADSIADYSTPMTALFFVGLMTICLIFIIFNIFIARFLKSLHENMESLKIASKVKSTFLANMSHEIRTPMNAILGITEIMIQNEALPDDIEEGLSKIYSSCGMLLGLINDILDFTKIEADKLDITPFPYEVASLINDSVQLNMMRIEDKPITFDVQVSENLPAKLVGDQLRIKQVLNNLLSNAFKYTDAGKITLSVTSEPAGAAVPGCPDEILLILSVRDTGRGMTQEQLDRVFEEYARFNVNATQGTGLGLAITQRLLKLMDGDIRAESEPGSGSLFTVRLPQKVADSGILGKEAASNLQQFRGPYMSHRERPKIKHGLMPYGNVLIVDDMETNLYVAMGLMKPYGLQIDTAMSGRGALDKIEGGKVYDVVFMDHMMPEMDGLETVKHLRDLGYTHPIVALTANAVSGQAELFLRSGFDEFISKPINVCQLDAILNKFVRDKQPAEVIEAAQEQNAAAAYLPELSAEEAVPDRYGIARTQLLRKGVPGLNIAKGLERYDGDEETYLKILRSYAGSVRAMLGSIETVSEDELPAYKIKVHGIKGASFDIFADHIGEKALALEKAAMAGDIGFVDENNPPFLQMTESFISGIDEMLSAIQSENTKPKKKKPDPKTLQKLLEACNTYSMTKADAAMAEIDTYQYEEDEGLADWLRNNVDMMNYDQVIEKLSVLLKL